MAAKTRAKGLGKGLDALFGDAEVAPAAKKPTQKKKQTAVKTEESPSEDSGVLYVSIDDIKPNSSQPRKTFDEEKLEELAASIERHGVIQPLVLRRLGKGYEIVAGERRWRAARIAGLKEIPCIVKELSHEENMLLAIIENMQREDLNPIEEAEGIRQMIDTYGLTQEQVSYSVGKSRPYISNSLRLLKLPDKVQELAAEGKISTGHARALAGVKNRQTQIELAMRDIGRMVYLTHTGTETDEEALQARLEEIDAKYAEIADLKAEQAALRTTVVCPVCGKTVDKNDIYCRVSGEKLQ